MALVAFYFAVSVPQVFLPDLDVILTLEPERSIVVRGALGHYLFSFSLSCVLSII